MMTRNSPFYEFSCDSCAQGEASVEESDVYDAATALKRLGWRISRRKHEWEHTCPDCQTAEHDFDAVV